MIQKLTLFILLSSLSESVLAKDVIQKCDPEVTYEKPTEIQSVRLYHGCDTKVKIKNDKNQIVQIPAGTRVMRLSSSADASIYFYHREKIVSGKMIADESEIRSSCEQNIEGISARAFLDEANLTLDILNKFQKQTTNPFFQSAVQSFTEKINQLKKNKKFNDANLKTVANQLISERNRHSLSKVDRLQYAFDLITKSFNPVLDAKGTVSQSTLVVPLNQKWFESNSKLNEFYQQSWIGSNEDIRIRSGSSGEGIQRDSDGFKFMSNLFLKTEAYIQKNIPEVQSSPEYQWLV